MEESYQSRYLAYEKLLADQIKSQLLLQQFSVDLANDGADGWFKLSEYPYDLAIIDALQYQWPQSDELVQEHIQWALLQQQKKSLLQQNLLSRQTDRLVRVIQKGLPRDA